jgi:hypothetical protein
MVIKSGLLPKCLRWPYQAKVIKVFEHTNNRIVIGIFHHKSIKNSCYKYQIKNFPKKKSKNLFNKVNRLMNLLKILLFKNQKNQHKSQL